MIRDRDGRGLTGLAIRDRLAARAPALRRLPTDSAARLSVQPRERVKLERAGGQEDRDVEGALPALLLDVDDGGGGEQVRVLLEDAEEDAAMAGEALAGMVDTERDSEGLA